MSEYERELKIYIESTRRNFEHIKLEIGLLEEQVRVKKRQLEICNANLEAEGETVALTEERLKKEQGDNDQQPPQGDNR